MNKPPPYWQGWVRRNGTWLVVATGDTYPETLARLEPRADPGEPLCILRYGTHPTDPVLVVMAEPDPDAAGVPVCRPGTHLGDLLAQIQQALAGEPLTSRELVDLTGSNREQVDHVLRRMERAGLVRRTCLDRARSLGKKAAVVWGLTPQPTPEPIHDAP